MREINKVATELFYKYSHIEEQTERLEKEYLKESTVIKYSKKLKCYTESLQNAKEQYKKLITELKEILIEKNKFDSPYYSFSIASSFRNNKSISILINESYEIYKSLVITNHQAFIKDEVNPEQYITFNEVICLGELQEIINKQESLLEELQAFIDNQKVRKVSTVKEFKEENKEIRK